MKAFTKEEIGKWREEFSRREYNAKRVEIDDRSIDYFLLPSGLFIGPDNIHIPNGLFRMTGETKDGYLIGVSEDVPEMIQQYFAVSEHDEFMVYGLGDLERTFHSEQNIISVLNNKQPQKTVYIGSKLVLYNHMLKHAKEDMLKWGFTPSDYKGFQIAREFLKGCI